MTEFGFPPGVPDDGTCMVFRNWEPETRCPEPAVCTTLVGCAGEQLRLIRYCALHLERLRAGRIRCRRCKVRAPELESHSVQLIRLLETR